MALLHVIDRTKSPLANPRSRHHLGAAASAAAHALLAAVLLIGLPHAARDRTASTIPFNPQRIIWIPQAADGSGRDSGGDRSLQPARRAETRGDDQISIPASPAPSPDAIADAPIEPIKISAVPMGHAQQFLAGPISSETPGDALGPNVGHGGNGNSRTPGLGNGTSTAIGDGPQSLGPGVTTPIPIQQVKPQYTADAMRAKIQGTVWLACVVLPDGTVGDVRVTRSLDRRFGLDDQAIAAARRWRFKPGLLKGQPVAVAVSIELTFTLR